MENVFRHAVHIKRSRTQANMQASVHASAIPPEWMVVQGKLSHPTWRKTLLWHNRVDHRTFYPPSVHYMCVWISGEPDTERCHYACRRKHVFVCVSVHWHVFMHVFPGASIHVFVWGVSRWIGPSQLWKQPSSSQLINQACSLVSFSLLLGSIFVSILCPNLSLSTESWPGSIAEPCDALSSRTPVPQRTHRRVIRNWLFSAGRGPCNIMLVPSQLTKMISSFIETRADS